MSLRQLSRKPIIFFRSTTFLRFRHILRRFQSSNPGPDTGKTQARANKILDRVPQFLRPYTDGLRNAPVSHSISFLILHELTAVVPLVGLALYFHYTNWLPNLADSSSTATYIEKFSRYFQRKQWFGFSEVEAIPVPVPDLERDGDVDDGSGKERYGPGRGMRIVWEVATAYAVTKALLPVRLMLSVWATPWFARVVVGKGWEGLVGVGASITGRGSAAASSGAVRMRSSVVKKDSLRK